MALRSYATTTDYSNAAEEDFDGDDRKLTARLRAASVQVDKLTFTARFDVDEDGYPADLTIADTFKEAVCAIVEHWELTGDPTGADASAGAISIGSVTLGTTSRATVSQSASDKWISVNGQKAFDIIAAAHLDRSIGY
jgi:hypothetical protein